VWLGEFAELDALRRTEVTRIKQFITNRTDHFRLPYGRAYVDLARRIVFCGSTNNTEWLTDPTGGRRFIPVRVGKVDLGWLRANREQLFAEAVRLFQAGRKWHRYPREETLAQQEQRSVEDPWEELIARYLCGRQEVTAANIINHALDLPARDQNKAASTRVGTTLSRLGCTPLPQHRVNGTRVRPWIVPEEFANQKIKVLPFGTEQDFNSPEATPPPAAQARPAKTSKTAQPSEAPARNGADDSTAWMDDTAAESVDARKTLIAEMGVSPTGKPLGPNSAAELVAGGFTDAQKIASADPQKLMALGPKYTAANVAELQRRAQGFR
jgi:predicted P-loop ATPase